MSPLGRWRRDPLRRLGLRDPVAATALIVRGDPGYSATTWWTASLRLRLTAPGRRAVIIDHQCRARRDRTPFTGLTVPVAVERSDPTELRIRWSEVPTLEERIANRYPLILAPRVLWRDVVDADPSQVDQMPDWTEEAIPGWSPGTALGRGRVAATALVIGHSWDPEALHSGNGAGPPQPSAYRYGGKLQGDDQAFLGWLLLCVIPPEGDRYGVHLRTLIRRDRLGPVLPVGIRPKRPADVEVAWQAAPDVRAPVEAIPEEAGPRPTPKPRRVPAKRPAKSANGKVTAARANGKPATGRSKPTQTRPAKPRAAAKKPTGARPAKSPRPRQVKAAGTPAEDAEADRSAA